MNTDPAALILERQVAWARRRNISLVGSKGERGRRVYAGTLRQNLFEPLSQSAHEEYAAGDGGELGTPGGDPGKMQALHSSSALCCNVFHYWRRVGRPEVIARACDLPSRVALAFEQKFPIDAAQFRRAPNLDAAFRCESGPIDVVGVESKFCEPFSTRRHAGLKVAYLGTPCTQFWRGLPALRKLAERISPDDGAHEYLDAAQLLKHILGLSRSSKRKFLLLYLHYAVPGPAGAKHESEISDFVAVAQLDGVTVRALTYQDVIVRLLRAGTDADSAYLDYIAERYL